eukprot:s117_g9.t2
MSVDELEAWILKPDGKAKKAKKPKGRKKKAAAEKAAALAATAVEAAMEDAEDTKFKEMVSEDAQDTTLTEDEPSEDTRDALDNASSSDAKEPKSTEEEVKVAEATHQGEDEEEEGQHVELYPDTDDEILFPTVAYLPPGQCPATVEKREDLDEDEGMWSRLQTLLVGACDMGKNLGAVISWIIHQHGNFSITHDQK